MQLATGLNGSVFAGGYPGASVPAAAGASPQASSIGQQAFGITAGVGAGARTSLYALLGGGALSLGLLAFIWWSLPR